MSTPATYAGSKEGSLDCAAAKTLILNDATDQRLDDHLVSCESCAVLAAEGALLAHALHDLPLPAVDTPTMTAAIQHQLAAERGLRARLQRLSTPQRASLLLGVAIAIVALTGLGTPRPDFAMYPVGRMLPVLGAFTLTGILALVRGLRPLHTSQATPWLVLAAGFVLPFVFAGLPTAHAGHPAAVLHGDFAAKTIACFAFGIVVAASVAKVAHLLDRRRHLDLTALMVIAAASGIVGNLALQLHCPITDPMHLIAGHASVGAVFAAGLAAVLSRRR